MWYTVDFFVLAVEFLLIALRKPDTVAFVSALMKPLDTLHYTWNQWRAENIYKLQHTGQVCYLRKSLNDKFDPSERRIYIGEANDYGYVVLYTEAENLSPVVVGTEPEQYNVLLRTEAEMDSDLDFIVYVPATVYTYQYHALKAQIEFYRQGGRRYAIFII